MILENTRILEISPALCDEDISKLSFAADIIRRGGTVCFPTETVYGLGANALDENAVSDIFRAKGRPQDNPLIIHLDSIEKAENYCDAKNNIFLEKISCFFPGPITAVLNKKSNIPDVVTAKLKSVGVRVPSHPVANKFLELCAVPVAAPSANISGRPSPTCAQHVIADLDGKVDVIISAGCTNVGLESTIVSLVKETPMLLRPGGITYEMLCEKLGKVDVSDAVLSEMKPGDTASAPGMKYKHYAPRAKVSLICGEESKVISFFKSKQQEENCAILAFSEDIPQILSKNVFDIGRSCDAASHAQHIFAHLRSTDEIEGLQNVYVHITGDKSGLNLAVFNRLLKASAYSIINL
ncbi:MAG: threonylcarbamoyl-AMP synthase [Clostridia bacterium]|nr:threonylcarbamoyl-AMP synthase [Clostridia bacterium]